MGNYAITENSYYGRLRRQRRWVVWNTKYDWEEAVFNTLVGALVYVAAGNGYLIAWSEM